MVTTFGHILELIAGLVWVVWFVAMHHVNSPTSVMSRFVLPVALLVAYGSILAVSYVAAEDPYAWPLMIVRVITTGFMCVMVLLIWMMRNKPVRQAPRASLGLRPVAGFFGRQAVSSGSTRGDELLAQTRRKGA